MHTKLIIEDDTQQAKGGVKGDECHGKNSTRTLHL